MTKYLYGASVQGIQEFIFQTNDLRDVVGASELVDRICTVEFRDHYAGSGETLLGAAGNIKHCFASEDECRRAVRDFPRHVTTMAPGITLSQAVVEWSGDDTTFAQAVGRLEDALRAQRNRPVASTTTGLMGMKRAPKTGLPAVAFAGGELRDAATTRKREALNQPRLCEKCFGMDLRGAEFHKHFAHDIGELTGANDWIAIIHADGNGLGQVVQRVGRHKEAFGKFSRALDMATVRAAQDAFAGVVAGAMTDGGVIPLRPVVLGGDDLTVIIRADLAVPYAEAFLHAFEARTSEHLGALLKEFGVFGGGDHLTACAGIAYVKSSYPFHYGYRLAEELCGRAKSDAKSEAMLHDSGPAPSCLMFHKVQDSYVADYDDIAKRELTPARGTSWEHGPYYLTCDDLRWTVEQLCDAVRRLRASNAVKTHMRRWLSLMHDDTDKARQQLNRAIAVAGESDKRLLSMLTRRRPGDGTDRYPAYDALSLLSVQSQVTRPTATTDHN